MSVGIGHGERRLCSDEARRGVFWMDGGVELRGECGGGGGGGD